MKLIPSTALSAAFLVSLAFSQLASATTYYIDPVNGNDTKDGKSTANAVKTIKQGGVLAGPGDTVNLRGGVYNDPAALGRNCVFDTTYSGTGPASNQVVTVQAYGSEVPVFDPGYPEFMSNPNTAWVPCTDPGAVSGEYISVNTYNMTGNIGAWGCFLNADKTAGDRLLSYTNIEDLRASNESWVLVPLSDPRPGLPAWGNTSFKYVWTYRGPGVWWDSATQKIHFRAAPTHYGQAGVTDYSGGSDPTHMSLSISLYGHEALNVYQADYVTFKNIVFQNGGNRTAEIGGSSGNYAEHVTFDHCSFFSSRNGTATTYTRFLTFQHCVFDGKLPSYVCRSDVKDSFDYVGAGGVQLEDGLCRITQAALLCTGINEDKEISHCEFRNSHDGIQLTGETRTHLHDSLIENCNDEAIMFYESTSCVDLRVYNNVIRSCMQAFSSSEGAPTNTTGARYIYRNIIDMRVPSLGFRSLSPDPVAIWRFGEDFKYNQNIPEFYCYQNTFVLADMDAPNSVLVWTNVLDAFQFPRKFMNNIVMILQTDKPLYSIPKIYTGNPYLSDGNLWCRRKAVLNSVVFNNEYGGSTYNTWTDFRNSALWTSYNTANGIGWETHPVNPPSPMAYAQFNNVPDFIQSYGHSWPNADYRLRSTSPAIAKGVNLVPYSWPDSLAANTTPDIGALPSGSSTLAVGVDSRILFPDTVTPVSEAGDYSIISDTAQQGYVSASFDASGSSTPAGSITGYNWVYNGQTIGTTSTFSKDLPIGNHQVYLTVTNTGGKTATDMRDIAITDPTLNDSIVRNAGFELGSTNWSLSSGASVVSTSTHFGSGALKAVGGASAVSATQSIPMVASASVKVSGWINTASIAAGTANVQVSWLTSGGASVGTPTSIGNVTGTTGWTYYTGTVTAPSTAATAVLSANVSAGATGTAYFDDLRLMIMDSKLLDGSFERNETDWTVTRGTPVVTTDPTLSHSGNGAIQMVGYTDYYQLSQPVPVTVGQPYYVEGWIKTVSMPTGTNAKFTVNWLDSAGNYAGVAWNPTVGGTSGGYTKVSTTLTPTAGKAYISIVLSIDSAATGGTAYFDDIYVK